VSITPLRLNVDVNYGDDARNSPHYESKVLNCLGKMHPCNFAGAYMSYLKMIIYSKIEAKLNNKMHFLLTQIIKGRTRLDLYLMFMLRNIARFAALKTRRQFTPSLKFSSSKAN
jgi:hypothetical protein